MRIWHRLKNVLPLLLALSTPAGVSAQGLFSSPGGGAPGFAGAPGQSAIGYAGMAPSFLSHPHISPFDQAVERHFSSDGLWFRDAVSNFDPQRRPYEYNVQLEWLASKVREFGEQVGDPNAITAAQENSNALLDENVLIYRMFFPPLMSQMSDVRPDGLKLTTTLLSRDGWSASLNAAWYGKSVGGYSARAERDRYRGDEVTSLVLAQTNGIGNPGPVFNNARNTSDLEIMEDFLLISGTEFDALTLTDIDLGLRENPEEVFNRSLLTEISLPLQNGVFAEGWYQRFDIEFLIRRTAEAFGGGVQFETGPLFEKFGTRFHGIVGGRYLRINEGFFFRGIDSGLSYTQANAPELLDRIDNDDDFFVDDIEEGGAGGSYAAYNPSNELLIRAFVDSIVQSNLGGPEIGLSYDLGRRLGITLTGSTRVGALLNHERVQLAGDNIGVFPATPENLADGDGLDVDPITGDDILSDLFDTSTSSGQPTQNAFTDEDGSRHVSPLFEQNVTANIPLFDRVPVLREVPILENSTLQLGWTFLWIGEVAEPQGSIVWESNPRAGLFPNLNVKRSDFYQNTFRLGVNCEY